MYINLVFAAFWLAFGLSLFVFRLEFANGVPAAWLALLLSLYNVLRFIGTYYRLRRNRQLNRASESTKPNGSPAEYYPMFDFSKSRAGTPMDGSGGTGQ